MKRDPPSITMRRVLSGSMAPTQARGMLAPTAGGNGSLEPGNASRSKHNSWQVTSVEGEAGSSFGAGSLFQMGRKIVTVRPLGMRSPGRSGRAAHSHAMNSIRLPTASSAAISSRTPGRGTDHRTFALGFGSGHRYHVHRRFR